MPLEEAIFTNEQLQKRIRELGSQIAADYRGKNPIMVGVLKGAFIFLAELMLEVTEPVEIDFIAVSSYGKSTKSSGVVQLLKDLDADISGRHVILVEDIVDSGLTLKYLRKNLEARKPASLEVCSLLVREKIKSKNPAKYVGFYIGDEFVVGHGFDVGERYRNLPDVYAYKP